MSTTTLSPIVWDTLSINPSEIHLGNPENINWDTLSINPSAIQLLEQNPERINWHKIRPYESPFNRIECRKIAYYLVKSGYITVYDDKSDGIISKFLQCYQKADKHYFYLLRFGYFDSCKVKSCDRVLNDYCSDMINCVETTIDDRWAYEYLRTYFLHREFLSQVGEYFVDRELVSQDI